MKTPPTRQPWEFTAAQKRRKLREYCAEHEIDPPCRQALEDKIGELSVAVTLGDVYEPDPYPLRGLKRKTFAPCPAASIPFPFAT